MLGGLLASAAATPTNARADDASREKPTAGATKLKVIFTGGHPGDPEYGCGGTIARLADIGHQLVLLYLNQGDPLAKTIAEASNLRVAEAGKACEILKARPAFAGQIDGHAIVDPAHYARFRELLEAERPDAVFTHWPIDNHADHRAISMLVYDAWVRMKKTFALYYYEVSNGEDTLQFAPTDYVDITATEARKRTACLAHASQSPEKYYPMQEMVTRFRGVESGHKQAEAFIRHVQSPAFPLPA